ncbi:MAG: hypothetical protein H8E12_15425 [Rhodobacteraceae bacterium]|nr:hypothetical protein [Paracoccaceae bacterium]
MNRNIIDIISDFLSSDINVFFLNFTLYGLLFYIVSPTLSTSQTIFMFVILVILSVLQHIKGVAQGMVIATIHREEMEQEIVQYMKKLEQEETQDEE